MIDSLRLQRAWVRGVQVRAEQLLDSTATAQQISLDQVRENRLTLEPAVDLPALLGVWLRLSREDQLWFAAFLGEQSTADRGLSDALARGTKRAGARG